jgi:hypothetical protein
MGFMPYPIAELAIPDELKAFKTVVPLGTPEGRLSGLSTLNAFIGPNNSGKSRLLRAIFDAPQLAYSPNSDPFTAIRSARAGLLAELDRLASDKLAMLQTAVNETSVPLYTDGRSRQATINKTARNTLRLYLPGEPHSGAISELGEKRGPIRDLLRALYDALEKCPETIELPSEVVRIHIPPLRGLRSFEGKDDLYRSRTIRDYFPRGNKADHPYMAST